jgi:hypothetical protein
MSKIKLDPKLRRQILNDWMIIFPTLKKETTNQISRRVGPVLFSIYLNKPSFDEIYRPRFSVTPLCNNEETLGASLSVTPDVSLIYLSWREHEKGKYKEAAVSLSERAAIPIEGPVSLDMILNGYKNYLQKEKEFFLHQLEDPALIAGWAGQPEKGIEFLKWSKTLYQEHIDRIKQNLKEAKEKNDEHNIQRWIEYLNSIDLDRWFKEVSALVYDQKKLQEYTNQQIEKRKLGKLPYEDLATD